MDTPSSRTVAHVGSEWSAPQVREALSSALAGIGPALAVGEVAPDSVPQEISLIVSTSGSTGSPKQVALRADAVKFSATASNTFLGAMSGDRWSLLLPTSHIAGINVVARSLDLKSELVDVNQHADFTAIVPTQLHRALNGDAQLLSHLQGAKAVLVGGAPLHEELHNSATQSGITVVTTYGMSETCGGCVYNGRPLPGVEIKIIDSRIAVRGEVLADGYLGSDTPFLTDGWFLTSDRGAFENGVLTVDGRIDDIIISGGEKISLSEITDFLNRHFSGIESLAISINNVEWGESLAIATDRALDSTLIREALIARYGAHASPKAFAVVDYIPKTSLGKPDRKKLWEEFGRLFS